MDDAERKYIAWLEENQPEYAERLAKTDQVLYEFQMSYQQPKYDPFEVFDPPVGMIVDIYRRKNREASDLLKEMRGLSREDRDFLLPVLRRRHEELVKELKSMHFRLTNKKKTGKWNKADDGKFTDEDKERAKTVPIENFYPGKFKRSGGRLFGICPFHSEKTGSFVVYTKNNSYHCFGCGESGDVIKFVQKMQNLSFVEAVKFLMTMV